jgi:ATP-dependent helicase HrpA
MNQANWQSSVADMREQLDRLVYRGFLQGMEVQQLTDLPRYLKALTLRLGKLRGAAARDQQRMQEMSGVHGEWLQRYKLVQKQGAFDTRLEEIRWMLEELRVSLFAQEIKTAQPISIKRIRKRWESLGL